MYTHLRDLRVSLGLTQEQFAKSINIAKTTYNNYETGMREPKSHFWIAVAKKYGVTIEYLMGYSDNQNRITIDTSSNVTESACSAQAARIAEAYDRADERDQRIVDTTLEPYMSTPATKENNAKLA